MYAPGGPEGPLSYVEAGLWTRLIDRAELRRPGLGEREAQRERAAQADGARHGNRSPELFHDLLGNREPQTESAALGGDEVVEDRLEPLRGDAAAGVGDFNDGVVVLPEGPHDDVPARRRGL